MDELCPSRHGLSPFPGPTGPAFVIASSYGLATRNSGYGPFDEGSGIQNVGFDTLSPASADVSHQDGSSQYIQMNTAGTYLVSFTAIANMANNNGKLYAWLQDGAGTPVTKTMVLEDINTLIRTWTASWLVPVSAGGRLQVVFALTNAGPDFAQFTYISTSGANPAMPSVSLQATRIA